MLKWTKFSNHPQKNSIGRVGPREGIGTQSAHGYLATQDRPLACERIVDVLETLVNDHSDDITIQSLKNGCMAASRQPSAEQ
jgi:hypothetical protein